MEEKRKYLTEEKLKRLLKVVTSPQRQTHFHRLSLARASDRQRLQAFEWRVVRASRRVHIVGLKSHFGASRRYHRQSKRSVALGESVGN